MTLNAKNYKEWLTEWHEGDDEMQMKDGCVYNADEVWLCVTKDTFSVKFNNYTLIGTDVMTVSLKS